MLTKEKLIEIYSNKIKKQIKEIESCNDDFTKFKYISEIAEGNALRYISLVQYDKLYKDAIHAFMYDYSKLFGKQAFKDFKLNNKNASNLINAQLKIYDLLLNNPQEIIKLNYPIKTAKGIQVNIW